MLSTQEIGFLNTHSPEEWPEYLVFRHKFYEYPNKRHTSDFPIYLLIEPVSACNLRCTMCFQIDESFTKSKKFMGIKRYAHALIPMDETLTRVAIDVSNRPYLIWNCLLYTSDAADE